MNKHHVDENGKMSLIINQITIIVCIALCVSIICTGNCLGNDIVINNVDMVDVIKKEISTNRQIIIKDGKIISLDQSSASIDGKTVIDGSDLIAIPGFINTHTHLWQHLAKGFYPNGNLQEWIRIYKFAHYLEENELYETTLAAASEGLLSGITTVADFASVNFSDFSLSATCEALENAHMGGILVFWNPACFLPSGVKAREMKMLDDRYKTIGLWMGHGPFSFYNIPSVYDAIHIAKKLNMNMSEHTMENVQEQRDFYKSLKEYLDKYGSGLDSEIKGKLEKILNMGEPSKVDNIVRLHGLSNDILAYDKNRNRLTEDERQKLLQWSEYTCISPVPLLEQFGAFDKKYISIHSVWQTQSDMDIYKKKNVTISHNPESNMYLSSGVAPILGYLENNIVVSLATDGAASNDGINFFSAMRGLWNLQKTETLDTAISKKIDAWYVLQAATINGAISLGIDDKTGSLEIGKEADITLLSKKRLKISPFVIDVNVIPLIIYSGSPIAVESVISNGKLVVDDGEMVHGKSVAELATTLSDISNNVYKRYNTGKDWTDAFDLDIDQMKSFWYKFRSIRKKDRIDIIINNIGAKDLDLYLAMSGEPFGGTASAMLSPETKQIFPLDPKPEFFDIAISLKQNESVQVFKNKNSWLYKIKKPNGFIKRIGKAEQLLFLVE